MPKHTLEPCYYERFGIVIGLGAHSKPKTSCSAHIQAQNLENSTQKCVCTPPDTFWSGKWAVRGKKKKNQAVVVLLY